MKTTLLLVLALLVLPMPQDGTPPSHGNPYPNDPDAYCLAGPPMANDSHGHECHCKMICSPPPDDPDGETVQREDPSCPFYCGQFNEHCLCHADQSCAGMGMEEPPR